MDEPYSPGTITTSRIKEYTVVCKCCKKEKPGSGGKVWIESKFHPGGGYWAEPSEVNLTWESLKAADEIERYLRS